MNQPQSSHYTFGDNALAALRLERLAAAYDPSSAAFLSVSLPVRVQRIVDLGCGLGMTTRLLRELAPEAEVIGYERSSQYVHLARSRFPDLTFRELDVLSPAFPDRDLDLVYCRFLLTHLDRPHDLVAVSVNHLRSGGRLLIEETSDLRSSIPALQTYYSMVQQLQAHYGQELYIGRRLDSIAQDVPQCRTRVAQTQIALPASTMAQLHAMNISTWKSDPFMSSAHGRTRLDALELELAQIAHSQSGDMPPVTCLMAQVVVERS